jgi:hypothetical protein
MPWTDGESLVPLAPGERATEPGAMEYAAEASYAPLVGLRRATGNTSTANSTRRSCSTSPPTRTN